MADQQNTGRLPLRIYGDGGLGTIAHGEVEDVLRWVAGKAADAAGSNAHVAPQLLFAHILWTLEAAQAVGTITVHPMVSAKQEG